MSARRKTPPTEKALTSPPGSPLPRTRARDPEPGHGWPGTPGGEQAGPALTPPPGASTKTSGPPATVGAYWRGELIRALAGGDPTQELERVTREAMDHVDEVLTANAPPRPLACAAGCAMCCSNQIAVSPMEAFVLCEAVQEAPDRERLVARILAARDSLAGKSRAEAYAMRREVPCPLLEKESCAVYQARPLACRGWHSLDASSCKTALDAQDPLEVIEHYPGRILYAQEVRDGLLEGSRAMRLETGHMLLPRALALILEPGRDWRAARREWLRGGRVFARG